MLAAVENALLPALQAALPGVTVQAGPAHDAPGELVALCAARLTLQPPPGGDSEPARARVGARMVVVDKLTANGKDRDFPLLSPGELAEVECPPGRIRLPGDDYLVAEESPGQDQPKRKTLKFFTAPAAGQAILLRFLGDSARGYVEQRGCRIELTLSTWARSRDRLDALLRSGLSALLAAAAELPRLEAEAADRPSVRMRLLRPVVALSEIQRCIGRSEEPKSLAATAQLVLHAELEITVAIGVADKSAVIKTVQVQAPARTP